MDHALIHHAHPHCHLLIKASGADTQFAVRESATEISGRLGFAAPSHFSLFFRNQLDVVPTGYRCVVTLYHGSATARA